MKSKQESLTNAIKRIDSSKQQGGSSGRGSGGGGGSKLYRPNSFLTNPQTVSKQMSGERANLVGSKTMNQIAEVHNTPRGVNNNRNPTPTTANTNNNKCSTLPMSHTTHDLTAYASSNRQNNNNQNNNKRYDNDHHQNMYHSNKNLSKSKPNLLTSSAATAATSASNGKLNKRFGLSPRFKRKIVETITNRVSHDYLFKLAI